MNMNMTTPAAGNPVSRSRKPRIMVAGEFSAGKSRLINALLGMSILPSNVTSTALPPIWLTGPGVASCVVGLDGSVSDYDIERIEDIDIEQTAFCVLSVDAPLLDHVDLIDTPGNSDPNIPAECWERMLPYADALVWCSSAMQAWKQSEKANCALMPEDLREQSLLVVTQADRMPDARSAEKVLRRVRREALPVLKEVVMASALDEGDVAAVKASILALAAAMPLRGQAEDLVDTPPRPAEPVVTRPAYLIDLTVPFDPTAPEPEAQVSAGCALAEEPAAAESAATPSADLYEDEAVALDLQALPAAHREPAEHDAEPVAVAPAAAARTGTSLLLPDGTVHRLWTDIVADQDLADNERFLTCISVLLSETRTLIRAGST